MNHFDNPNRVRLLSNTDQRTGLRGGQFVRFTVDNTPELDTLGLDLFCEILDIRPVAIKFNADNHRPALITHDESSRDFARIVDLCGNMGEACYGYEVAVEFGGEKFIMSFCTITGRRFVVDTLRHLIGRSVQLRPVLNTSSKFSWYTMEAWVPVSCVQSFKPTYEPDPWGEDVEDYWDD
jgi:hypothetical protein